VNAAIVSYYASKASFQTLAPATQMLRRVYLEKLRERYGKNAITSMRPEFVAQMIDRMTPSSAHNWIKSIRGLMQHAIGRTVQDRSDAGRQATEARWQHSHLERGRDRAISGAPSNRHQGSACAGACARYRAAAQ